MRYALARRNRASDQEEWVELQRAAAGAAAGKGERSAAEWESLSYPLFGRDEVANRLLQAADELGGEGVRFSLRSIQGELALFKPTVLRTRLGPAARALASRGYLRPVEQLSDPERGRLGLPLKVRGKVGPWQHAWELTLLGHEAALASRIVPGLRRAQEEDPIAREVAQAELRELAREPAGYQDELRARGVSPELARELSLPWRSYQPGGEFSTLSMASGQRLGVTREHQGGYVVFRAWDTSPYLQGQRIQVGELALRPSGDPGWPMSPHAYATVAWVWAHPEWSDPSVPAPYVLTRLHEQAAQEAARQGLRLASPVDRSPAQDRFWRHQVQRGRADPWVREGPAGLTALRYGLAYPPPLSLENPHRQRWRRNVDPHMRRLERAARSGDRDAKEALFTARLRAGQPQDFSDQAHYFLTHMEEFEWVPEHVLGLDDSEFMDFEGTEGLTGRYLVIQAGSGVTADDLWAATANTEQEVAELMVRIQHEDEAGPWFPVFVVDLLHMEPAQFRHGAAFRRQGGPEGTHWSSWYGLPPEASRA